MSSISRRVSTVTYERIVTSEGRQRIKFITGALPPERNPVIAVPHRPSLSVLQIDVLTKLKRTSGGQFGLIVNLSGQNWTGVIVGLSNPETTDEQTSDPKVILAFTNKAGTGLCECKTFQFGSWVT